MDPRVLVCTWVASGVLSVMVRTGPWSHLCLCVVALCSLWRFQGRVGAAGRGPGHRVRPCVIPRPACSRGSILLVGLWRWPVAEVGCFEPPLGDQGMPLVLPRAWAHTFLVVCPAASPRADGCGVCRVPLQWLGLVPSQELPTCSRGWVRQELQSCLPETDSRYPCGPIRSGYLLPGGQG